jgi:hypothetical protein
MKHYGIDSEKVLMDVVLSDRKAKSNGSDLIFPDFIMIWIGWKEYIVTIYKDWKVSEINFFLKIFLHRYPIEYKADYT